MPFYGVYQDNCQPHAFAVIDSANPDICPGQPEGGFATEADAVFYASTYTSFAVLGYRAQRYLSEGALSPNLSQNRRAIAQMAARGVIDRLDKLRGVR